MKVLTPGLKLFPGCPPLDGYHCQTNALAKIYRHAGHPLSEEMLLGLGAGMGFIYWQMTMGEKKSVFIGGRGNNKEFFSDVGRRTGVKITSNATSSAKKAKDSLLEKLEQKQPVMVFGDMGFLPWFDFPEEYHFGGHTFLVCGWDRDHMVLASDMDPKSSGLKKGFYHPISLEQLEKARSSTFKPFPPKNTWLDFDFKTYHPPTAEDFNGSIGQTAETLLHPPIKNIGVKGLRHTAREITRWPLMFTEQELRMNLFTLYIYIEIGGTGGGCFRYMYSRFLGEAAKITGNRSFLKASGMFNKSGRKFTETGLLFLEAQKMKDLNKRIGEASRKFLEIAEIEEQALNSLKDALS